MEEKDCKYCDFTPRPETDLLYETKQYRVFLAQDQSYLGRCTVATKRHVGTLSLLTPEEWMDFSHVVSGLEHTLTQAFGAANFNWTSLLNCTMNNAQPNPHVHWHFLPRYRQPVVLGIPEVTFTDPDFGKHYDRARSTMLGFDTRLLIKMRISEYLPESSLRRTNYFGLGDEGDL
jgi:diadenosine tetraphosphate (Ap4A) HIT family hydrolase